MRIFSLTQFSLLLSCEKKSLKKKKINRHWQPKFLIHISRRPPLSLRQQKKYQDSSCVDTNVKEKVKIRSKIRIFFWSLKLKLIFLHFELVNCVVVQFRSINHHRSRHRASQPISSWKSNLHTLSNHGIKSQSFISNVIEAHLVLVDNQSPSRRHSRHSLYPCKARRNKAAKGAFTEFKVKI